MRHLSHWLQKWISEFRYKTGSGKSELDILLTLGNDIWSSDTKLAQVSQIISPLGRNFSVTIKYHKHV